MAFFMTKNNIKFDQPLNILVVEDNDVDRILIESLLRKESNCVFKIVCVRNLFSAKKAVEQNSYDAILLDLNLDDSKGDQTLKDIRSYAIDIAIVVVTGEYQDDLGIRLLACGAQDFLIKGKYNGYILNKVLHYAVERKRMEMELWQVHQQLIQAEKMKVVGSLAMGVAHEVRNPLSTILYGINYLSKNVQTKDKNYPKVLEDITEAVQRSNEIITDLLDFSNLSKVDKKKINVSKMLEKGLKFTKHDVEKGQIQIKKSFSSDSLFVNVDESRILQVIVNLVLNAVKAMGKGGVLLIKTACLDDGSQKRVIIDFEDQGCGIAEDKIGQIFDPFFTTHRTKGGVGLGLSVSKNIMEIHDAQIAITNLLEGGVRARMVFEAN